MMPEISVIIPTFNESAHIQRLVRRVCDSSARIECIIVDGGSTDSTVDLALKTGAKVIIGNVANRAVQLNLGAQAASAKTLYFVHADTLPPVKFSTHISSALADGNEFGCFRFRFSSPKRLLRINSWCTRFPFMIFRGGDQSLFITKNLFGKLQGYDESKRVMEDYDIIARGKKHAQFKVIQDDIEVSARKYDDNGYFRVNSANLFIFTMYYLGVPAEKLASWYGKLIRHPKPTKTDQKPVSVNQKSEISTFAPSCEPDSKPG